MNLKYTSPAKDYSGYGEASRHDIGALVSAGVEVTTEIPQYVLEIGEFGRLGSLAQDLEERELEYNIKILHVTPNVYGKYFEAGKYHIGRAFWETDRVPDDFAKALQAVDEIWTGSEFNADAIRRAGVTKPIYIIPEAIDTDIDIDAIEPLNHASVDRFNFYSVFEWTERKNPTALLEAFWTEFKEEEKVGLVLKTYVDNFTPEKKREIRDYVKQIKKRLGLTDSYAPAFVYSGLLQRDEMYRFHKSFDCFVSAHRGEGWGIPQMEAMLMGKPIISTGCGGIHEYLTDKEDAHLLPYNLIPVRANTRNQKWYAKNQNWADIDIMDLRKAMREVYRNQVEAGLMGKKAQKTVKEKFSLPVVGKLMRERLKQIGR